LSRLYKAIFISLHKLYLSIERVLILNHGENSIGRWISVLYRCRKSYAGRRLEPYGIAGCQYLFLMTLYRNNGASQEKISDYLKIDKTTTAKAIKKLEDGGFVVRDIDASDKRAYMVFLTQKALDIIPHIQETMKNWENAVVEDISEDEYILLEKLLEKMADKARSISAV
jgi:DNA-binding MarR family transcriptional regulator